MFALNDINNELEKYNRYMCSELKPLYDIRYIDKESADAQVKKQDLNNGKAIIYISKGIDNYPLAYQKSLIWHEFTHIYDYEKYSRVNKEFANDILKSYSEAHAESIKFRYLLKLSIKQPLTNVKTKIITEKGITTFEIASGNLMNQSIYYMTQFLTSHNPYHFDNAINFALYFYGAISLLPKGKLVLKRVLEKYPKEFGYDVYEIGEAILQNDVDKAVNIYRRMTINAVKYSIQKPH